MLYVELLLSTIRKAASSLNRTEYWQNISVLVYWLKHILRHCKKPVAEKWLMLFYFLYEAFFLLGGGGILFGAAVWKRRVKLMGGYQ